MKVNMNLLEGGEEKEKPVEQEEKPAANAPPVPEEDDSTEEDGGDEDDGDESDKHSKLKTVLLVGLMLGGFAVFVFNMRGLVNNMRLDNQGSATTNIVYDMGDRIDGFMDIGEDGSVTVDVEDHEEREVPTDADRDGPEESAETPSYENESAAIAAMRQEVDKANNYAALKEQELKNAEDMLDSSLQREAELRQEIEKLGGNN